MEEMPQNGDAPPPLTMRMPPAKESGGSPFSECTVGGCLQWVVLVLLCVCCVCCVLCVLCVGVWGDDTRGHTASATSGHANRSDDPAGSTSDVKLTWKVSGTYESVLMVCCSSHAKVVSSCRCCAYHAAVCFEPSYSTSNDSPSSPQSTALSMYCLTSAARSVLLPIVAVSHGPVFHCPPHPSTTRTLCWCAVQTSSVVQSPVVELPTPVYLRECARCQAQRRSACQICQQNTGKFSGNMPQGYGGRPGCGGGKGLLAAHTATVVRFSHG